MTRNGGQILAVAIAAALCPLSAAVAVADDGSGPDALRAVAPVDGPDCHPPIVQS